MTEYNSSCSSICYKNYVPVCINLILKPLIALKFIILLIIMLVDSSYFLELFQKYLLFFFTFLYDSFFKLFASGQGWLPFVCFGVLCRGLFSFQWNWQKWMTQHAVVINSSPINLFFFYPRVSIYSNVFIKLVKYFCESCFWRK